MLCFLNRPQPKSVMTMGQFIVTGCPRSGTKWTSWALRLCGVPCGHEAVFRPRGVTPATQQDFAVVRGDVSWLAAPFVSEFRNRATIIHQIRHPLKVIASMVCVGSLTSNTSHARFKYAYLPRLRVISDAWERATYFWAAWNELIDPSADEVYRIDLDPPERLFTILGYDPEQLQVARRLASLSRDLNHAGTPLSLDWAQLTALAGRVLTDRVRRRALAYGYEGE